MTCNICSPHFLVLNYIVSYVVLFGVTLFYSLFGVCFLSVKQEILRCDTFAFIPVRPTAHL